MTLQNRPNTPTHHRSKKKKKESNLSTGKTELKHYKGKTANTNNSASRGTATAERDDGAQTL